MAQKVVYAAYTLLLYLQQGNSRAVTLQDSYATHHQQAGTA